MIAHTDPGAPHHSQLWHAHKADGPPKFHPLHGKQGGHGKAIEGPPSMLVDQPEPDAKNCGDEMHSASGLQLQHHPCRTTRSREPHSQPIRVPGRG